jgi:excisionase family DNA binding protein
MHTDAPVILAFTPSECAASLRISKTKLFVLLRTGSIASYRVGRSRRISLRAIEEYQARLEAAEQRSMQEGRIA